MTPDKLRNFQEYRAANAIRSVYDLLRVQAAIFSNHDLLVVPESVASLWSLPQATISYRQMLDQVDVLAARYEEQGYGAGQRVALLLENRPAHFIHWLALNSLGVSVVPINPDYTDDEAIYSLTHSESCLLVTLRAHLERFSSLAGAAGIRVWCDDDDAEPPSARDSRVKAAADAQTECALLYTSGTTGRPKGCQLSNDYFHAWAHWYGAQVGGISLGIGYERLITPLPAFHINAMGNSFMGMLACGGAQIIVDRFHPSTWLTMAISTRATCFHYLGVMPAILLEIPAHSNDKAHSLRFGMGGGVHPDHHARFERRFSVPLLEGWAMTETGGAGILCAAGEPRHVGSRCIGSPRRPGPSLEIKLVDENGVEVPAETPGELLLRAPGQNPRLGFFSGYLKDPEATNALWRDGWLHTGDIMSQANDSTLRFVDRKKNIIRRSGENIAAIEVESAILAHPKVKAVAVIAVLDPLREEEVFAAIVPLDKHEGNGLLAWDVFHYCREQLTYFKVPGYIAFVDELPTTSTQKVRKADLGTLAQDPATNPDIIDLREAKQQLRPSTRRAST